LTISKPTVATVERLVANLTTDGAHSDVLTYHSQTIMAQPFAGSDAAQRVVFIITVTHFNLSLFAP
jgi:hypothetical protein